VHHAAVVRYLRAGKLLGGFVGQTRTPPKCGIPKGGCSGGVYYERFFVAAGGLICYGTDFLDQFRRAAGYVDRILKGEKPADLLPVQAPTKYQLAINLKTAKTLGLEDPQRRCSPAPTCRALLFAWPSAREG